MAAGIGVFVAKDWVFDRILFGPRIWTSSATAVGAPCPTPSARDALCVERISYELINTTMLGNFSAHLIVSAVGGLIVAFPSSSTKFGRS